MTTRRSLSGPGTSRGLAVVDWSQAVRVWTLDFDELVDIGRRRATRELSDDERRAIDDTPP